MYTHLLRIYIYPVLTFTESNYELVIWAQYTAILIIHVNTRSNDYCIGLLGDPKIQSPCKFPELRLTFSLVENDAIYGFISSKRTIILIYCTMYSV